MLLESVNVWALGESALVDPAQAKTTGEFHTPEHATPVKLHIIDVALTLRDGGVAEGRIPAARVPS